MVIQVYAPTSNAEGAEFEWFYEDLPFIWRVPIWMKSSKDLLWRPTHQGFPGGSEVKVSASDVGDPGSIPGLGRSPGEGNGITPVFLPGESHGRRSLGSQRVRHDWATSVHFTSWRPTRPSRTNTPKRCPFHYRGLECKSRKSRNTWSFRQIWPGVQNEAGQRLIEFYQENAVVIATTREDSTHGHHLFQQHKRRLYTWTSPSGQYWNQINYILCSRRWRSSIELATTRLGADCGWDHELLISKFRLKLKKAGKTTRPFRYDLNQIPNDYTVEVTNRFKGLDLIECLMNYGWRFVTLYRRQGARPSPRKRNAKKQNGCLRRPYN